MGNGNNHISMPFHTFGSAPDRKILARPALRPDVIGLRTSFLYLEHVMRLTSCYVYTRVLKARSKTYKKLTVYSRSQLLTSFPIFSAMPPRPNNGIRT